LFKKSAIHAFRPIGLKRSRSSRTMTEPRPFDRRISAVFRSLSMISLTVAAGLAVTAPARAQDADAGKTVFKQVCSICHEVAKDRNRVGPSLFGIVGRKSGEVPGFHYSDANKAAAITWDAATLDKYLAAPRAVVPGTTMAYAGLKDDQKRKDLIGYLTTVK